MRYRLREAIVARGLEEPARALRDTFVPFGVRRDRLDHRHLRIVLAASLAPDSNCIDVGAHTGGVLEHMVELAPHGRHIAFEPIPSLHAVLCSQFPHVSVRPTALSDWSGESDFTLVASRLGYSGFRERTYPGRERIERIKVRVERLDDVLPPDYQLTLIKIDVEGAEREVIAGGLETLARHRPLVVFEHGRGAADHYGTTPEAVHDLLGCQAGLRIFDLDGGGPYGRDQFAEIFEQGRRWNFLARP